MLKIGSPAPLMNVFGGLRRFRALERDLGERDMARWLGELTGDKTTRRGRESSPLFGSE
jgi:hypothetical protein